MIRQIIMNRRNFECKRWILFLLILGSFWISLASAPLIRTQAAVSDSIGKAQASIKIDDIEDVEEGELSRIATPGKKAFELRQGENGISVFHQKGVDPNISDEGLLENFREGSHIVKISYNDLIEMGFTVVWVEGDEDLPQNLRDAHYEIRPGAEMNRNAFKKKIKELP